jgi:hypothetical protein
MASKKPADIVKAYLEEHPDTPSRTIATYLNGRYPNVWGSSDACLNQIRYYRGQAGKENRKKRINKPGYPTIPASERRRSPDVRLTTPGRWLLVSDFHVPYHDETAIDAAIRYAIDHKCDHILVNGDALDAYQQSCWIKDPNKRNTDSEMESLSELLKSIESRFDKKVYKIGNHEERIENYLFMNAPKMIGMSKWNLCEELKKHLDIPDWQMIASKQLYKLGKLNGYHGHELPKGLTNPVSVGRGVWLRTKQTGFTSHWHSTSTHVETSGDKRKTWVCFSVGALCQMHPDYAPINGWNQGFAVVDIDSAGNFNETNLRIDRGKVW